MAKAAAESISTPSREDFAAMLEESFIERAPAEGSVVKGHIVAVENDYVVVDVGLKTEGRVPLKEFTMVGQPTQVKIGDEVEVFVERVENAMGEAVLSRDKARREECWAPSGKGIPGWRPRHRRDLRPRQGRLHRRSRWRGGVPARKPSRCAPGARCRPADEHTAARSRF